MYQDTYDQYFVAYFDFLGFKEYVKNTSLASVLFLYRDAIKNIYRKTGGYYDPDTMIYQWFSDTFLFCVKLEQDDVEKPFMDIYRLSTTFFRDMICKGIPLRGALTLGGCYADTEHDIFLGEAIIEAYDYAENQNWIGFVLTPEILPLLEQHKCEELIGLVGRTYAEYEVPYRGDEKRKLLAWRLDKYNKNTNIKTTGDYYLWNALVQMEQEAPEEARGKYDNTKKFMLKNCPPLKKLFDKENQKAGLALER